jgi:aldehyde dehydrogenase (NAD+)
MSHDILKALGLTGEQSGTYLGKGEWSKTTSAGTLQPLNPATGEVIGTVHASSADHRDPCPGRLQSVAHHPCPAAWRGRSPLR